MEVRSFVHTLASRIVLLVFFFTVGDQILEGWHAVVGHCIFYAFLWTAWQRIADMMEAP